MPSSKNYILGAAILRRIFKEYFDCDWAARFVLIQADQSDSDPFRICAAKFGISEIEIYHRASQIINAQFCETIPVSTVKPKRLLQVDNLHMVRSVEGKLDGKHVLFVAPNFWRFFALTISISKNRALRDRLCIVPPRAIQPVHARQHSAWIYQHAVHRLVRKWPFASAHIGLSRNVRFGFLIAVLLFSLFVFFTPKQFEVVTILILGLVYLLPAAFRLYCAFYGRDLLPMSVAGNMLANEDLPVYTVLIPLRDEVQMVPQLFEAMNRLNYPKEKLDIKFVVESTSSATVSIVHSLLGAPQFELILVPDSAPRTKPKAVNYALPFARGEHIVIFDAEDIPSPNQLRQAATIFANNLELECLQASLTIDNASENGLTALFAAEYAAQFGLIMPTLAHFDLPMPLGGTSNHFRTATLLNIGAWDSFNVTEDADLGVRLSRRRLRTAMLASYTREEAPVQIWPWIKQRSRWMKGWMQTLLVHSQDFKSTFTQMGAKKSFVFYLYVGGMVFSAPLHGLFFARLIYDLITHQAAAFDDYSVLNFHLLVMVIGYSTAIAASILGLIHTRQLGIAIWQLLIPLYWILTSFATLRAVWQLAFTPFQWEKTGHAKTKVRREQFNTPNSSDTPSTDKVKSIYL